MMRVREHEDLRRTHLPVVKSGGKVCGASFGASLPSLIIFVLVALAKPAAAQNGTFTLSSAPGGIAFTVGGGGNTYSCLLYTSDAADERSSVDLGGRRII